MILFRKYGKTIEITETQKEPSTSFRRLSSSKKDRSIIAIRRVDSVRRTKRICLRKLLSAIEVYGSPLFITLTFEGSASDVFLCSKHLSNFFRRLRIEFPNSQCLIVPELSPRGRVHFHGLLFNVSQEWGDEKKGKRIVSVGRERRERKFQKLWGVGFVDVLKTDGSPRLATYVAKYVAKTVTEPFLVPLRLIRTTVGFPNCIEIRGLSMSQLDRAYNFKKLLPAFINECYSPFLGNIRKTFYNML